MNAHSQNALSDSEQAVLSALREKRNADLQAQIEAEKAEIEQDRKDAPGYVIGLIERDLKVYQEQAKRLRGHAFERNEVYLSALWKARAALQKAFDRECEPMADPDRIRDDSFESDGPRVFG